MKSSFHLVALLLIFSFISFGCSGKLVQKEEQTAPQAEVWGWETLSPEGQPTARHEAGFIAYKDQFYLMGGRRINPTSVYDPINNSWSEKAAPPIEIHHFQPVVFGNAIYIIGALTGGWPNETPLERVMVYYPEQDAYSFTHTIPEHRRRGGAGLVVYNDKIYVVGGITHGHMNGFQTWLDEYNPRTGEWTPLADAPFPMDHFQATVSGDKLYAFGGAYILAQYRAGYGPDPEPWQHL